MPDQPPPAPARATTDHERRPGPARARWPLASGGLALLIAGLAGGGAPGAGGAALDMLGAALALERPAALAGELWRLWSGHLVHYSPQHALLDALVLLLFGAIAERAFGTRRLLAELCAAAPAISAALLLTAPGMLEYRGASGLATYLAARAAAALWRRHRPLAALLAATLLLRTAGEALGLQFDSGSLPPGVLAAWQAHAFALAAAAIAQLRTPPPIPIESVDS